MYKIKDLIKLANINKNDNRAGYTALSNFNGNFYDVLKCYFSFNVNERGLRKLENIKEIKEIIQKFRDEYGSYNLRISFIYFLKCKFGYGNFKTPYYYNHPKIINDVDYINILNNNLNFKNYKNIIINHEILGLGCNNNALLDYKIGKNSIKRNKIKEDTNLFYTDIFSKACELKNKSNYKECLKYTLNKYMRDYERKIIFQNPDVLDYYNKIKNLSGYHKVNLDDLIKYNFKVFKNNIKIYKPKQNSSHFDKCLLWLKTTNFRNIIKFLESSILTEKEKKEILKNRSFKKYYELFLKINNKYNLDLVKSVSNGIKVCRCGKIHSNKTGCSYRCGVLNQTKYEKYLTYQKRYKTEIERYGSRENRYKISFNNYLKTTKENRFDSKGQRLLFESINTKNKIYCDREVINPLEIDILLPDLKLGIEYNGTIWHSYNVEKSFRKEMKYVDSVYETKEYKKYLLMKEKGFNLMSILETDNIDFYKNIINNNLKLNKPTTINKIKPIDTDFDFIKLYYYKIIKPKKLIGYYSNDELIAVKSGLDVIIKFGYDYNSVLKYVDEFKIPNHFGLELNFKLKKETPPKLVKVNNFVYIDFGSKIYKGIFNEKF